MPTRQPLTFTPLLTALKLTLTQPNQLNQHSSHSPTTHSPSPQSLIAHRTHYSGAFLPLPATDCAPLSAPPFPWLPPRTPPLNTTCLSDTHPTCPGPPQPGHPAYLPRVSGGGDGGGGGGGGHGDTRPSSADGVAAKAAAPARGDVGHDAASTATTAATATAATAPSHTAATAVAVTPATSNADTAAPDPPPTPPTTTTTPTPVPPCVCTNDPEALAVFHAAARHAAWDRFMNGDEMRRCMADQAEKQWRDAVAQGVSGLVWNQPPTTWRVRARPLAYLGV